MGTTLIQTDIECFAHFSGCSGPRLQYSQISDAVVMYMDLEGASYSALTSPQQLITSTSYAISVAMAYCLTQGIALRGAIAYGECYIYQPKNLFYGPPVQETQKIERMQNWAGAILCPSAKQAVQDGSEELHTGILVEHDVEMKEARPEGMTQLAVKWPGRVCDLHRIDWDSLFNTQSPDVIAKKNSTHAFYEQYKGPDGLPMLSIPGSET